MTWLRYSLIGAIFFVSFLLIIRWNEFDERRTKAMAPETLTVSSQTPAPATDVPPSSEPSYDDEVPKAEPDENALEQVKPQTASTQIVEVKTDVLHVLIDTKGGDIIQVTLPKYLADIDLPESEFVLLNRSSNHTYIAQSGLVGKNATHTAKGRAHYSVAKPEFKLQDTEDSLRVDLTFTQETGAEITKRFTFERDSYLIKIDYLIKNSSPSPWQAKMYGSIRRDNYKPPSDVGIGVQPFVGAAITTPETNYKKFDFGDIDDLDSAFKVSHQGGWVAMVQHYFMSAWVPNPEEKNDYTIKKSSRGDLYFFEYTGEFLSLEPNAEGKISSSYYAGPKIIKNLEKIAPYLDLTIDFSWLWFISKPLFIALDYIHAVVGNWGIAIILLTCLVKIIFFYPSAMSYRSMAKMRKIMPLMQELKERYGDDRQRMGVETMKLYKKEGVNPLGGCLPMLLQMPVFIALYWALMESVELRHSPFFLWIEDLSVKDPYFILPLIMGATMFFQQKLNPKPQDPMQAKIMQMMPIFFTLLFLMFPAGLVLYWVTNNMLSIAQQYVITKQIENETSK